MNFSYQTGTSLPGSQAVYVSNSGGIVTYNASVSASWVKMTSNLSSVPAQSISGTSNSNLNIYVDPTGLSQGSYNSYITVLASTGGSQSVLVNLTVSNSSILSAAPSSLTFNYLPDTGVPIAQLVTITTTGSAVSYTASASSSGWLLVGPQSGNTNSGSNVLTVSVIPTSLPAGTYSGAVNITSGSSTFSVPVTLNVGTASFSSITANPSVLSFQSQTNAASSSQTISLSSLSTKSFLASASASGGSWLQVSPSSGFTPSTLTVTINPQLVSAAGVYSGLVQISNLTDGTQLTVPVTMTLTGPSLSVSPQALSFTLASGSPTAVSQTVQVSGSVNTAFNVYTDSSWLTVSPTTAAAPAQLTIFANAANLSPGNYTGIVSIVGGGATTTVTVNASVGNSASLTLNPTNLSFGYNLGAQTPSSQSIAVTSSTGATLNFSTTVRTNSGGNWLLASANSFNTPATLTVSVQPAGLTPGTYRGVVTVTTLNSAETRSADVILTVNAQAPPSLRSEANAATRQLSPVTPGMIVSLFGNGLGPIPAASGIITAAGAFEAFYSTYRVFFDGVPAPILYISDTQIDVVAPYTLAGRSSTRVEVDNAGVRSNALELVVSRDAAPGIFTLDNSGRGQAAALNQNGTINGPGNPAAANSVIVLYATGEGQTEPAGQDGRIINTDLRKPVLPVAVTIGGVPVDVLYAGSAPGLVSGLMQVNVRLNANVPRGFAVPVELRVGPAPSPAGVTVAIQ